jgi:Protein of unknown function (DUF3489)
MEMIPMTTTEFSKKQLTTILSALDDAPRNPANKGEALRAISRSAQRFGLSTDDVLAAAPGLLDGRLSPADFRLKLHDLDGSAPVPATEARESAPETQEEVTAGQEPQAPTEPAQAATAPAMPAPAADAREAKPAGRRARAKAKAMPGNAASAGRPTPRAGTKQALMIELLKRPEGATVEQIATATGWQKHTIRGAISGALKKKLGLTVEATRTREVGANKVGAKGSSTVYRILGSRPSTA